MTAANDPSFSASTPQPADSATQTPSLPESTTGPPESGPESSSIRLPPLSVPPEDRSRPEQFAAEIARLDRALAAVVLALAFLLASIAVRNSDFWMHLATGRLLAHGEYHFGVDPFSYTATAYWANHSWLYDLILYGLASAAGGPESEAAGIVLVVVKALLVTLLAGVMLRIRRPGGSLWIPAICTMLALLAMSPRLLLQPTIISLLFLSLTLYILRRPRLADRDAEHVGLTPRRSRLSYWLLVPLFALWVNLDSWFLLGPITLTLYFLGQWLERWLSPGPGGSDALEPGDLRMLGLVLVAGLAACLASPHHYHAFVLPAQLPLTAATEVLEREDLFRQFFYWLLQEDYWQSAAAWTIAGLAVWPLLVLAVASFVGSVFVGGRWWRLTVGLAFLLLGVFQVRALPFFAVVAAPITVLNLQDMVVSRFGPLPRVDRLWKTWSLMGRLGTLLAALCILAAAWSGWLFISWVNGIPSGGPAGRRVAWTVDVEPSLRKTALQLRTWRDEGLLRSDDHGFNYSPDTANYCAWFCPEEKGFFDYRLDLFPAPVAREFVDVRQALRGSPPPAGQATRQPTDWRELFRNQHINHVVLYGSDTSPLNPGMQTSVQAAIWMLFDQQTWTLAYMDGRSTIFRWNDPGSTSAQQRPLPRFDPNGLAFGPRPEKAPAESPEQAPRQPDLMARWLQRPPLPPIDTDSAGRYLGYFNQIRQEWPLPAVVATEIANWSRTAGQAAIAPGSVTGPATLALHSFVNFSALGSPRALEFFLRDKSYGPAAAPILAVRAARRALAVSPDYAASFLTLAEAYAILWGEQEDHWVGLSSSGQDSFPRQKLRDVQLLTALEYYLILRPQDGEAHWRLFQNYARLQYWDLAMDHLRVAVDFMAATGPGRRESREEFKRRLDQMQQDYAKRKAELKNREDDYQVDARNKPLSGKVQKALQNGLIRRARDLLLEADPAQLGPGEIDLLLDLLVSTGHPDQARAGLSENLRTHLGLKYEWYNFLIGAACGNYREAGQFLEEYVARLEQATMEGALRLVQIQTFQGGLSPTSLYGVGMLPNRARELADARVLRGLVALEQGENGVAADYFQAALAMGDHEEFRFESRPIALRYLQLIQEAGRGP